MNRLVLLAPILLFLIAAKPAGMVLTHEQVFYGFDAIPGDGCLGADELLNWAARGRLGRGESFSYSFREPDCHAFRIIEIHGNAQHGQDNLVIELDVHDTLNSWHLEAVDHICFKVPSGDGQGMKFWTATITNLGSGKDVVFSGTDYDHWFYPGSECPVS